MILVKPQTGPMPKIIRIVLPFILFLLVSSGVFSQSVTKTVTIENPACIVATSTTNASIALEDTQVDFVIWFMGSNQSQNNETTSSTDNTSTSRKKQFISSGTSPNKVLYRTFVKKVYSQEHAIV